MIKYPQIAPTNRSVLTELFATHKRGRFLIDTVIEGQLGTAIADSESNPQVAQLTLYDLQMFGGDPGHPVARELIQNLSKTCFLPESEVWRDLIVQIHGERLEKRLHIDFSYDGLNSNNLQELKSHVPEGFHIQWIDIDIARRFCIDKKMHTFISPEDFVERGIGFCATIGDRLASFAVSYVKCKRGIDISIFTYPDFRRKGLATVVSAALIEYCLEYGIEPHWDAANSISANLAEKLGYIQCDSYDELSLSD